MLARDFKVAVIKILTGLEKRMEDLSETLNKETENIKKNQSEMKNSITKIKSTLGRINRLDEAEEWISDLEGRVMGSHQAEWEKKIKTELGNSATPSSIKTFAL